MTFEFDVEKKNEVIIPKRRQEPKIVFDLIEEIEEEGIAGDSYGMKVAFAGAVHGETLFVWAGYENQQQMIEQLAVFNDSESFANFNNRTQGFSSIVANEISTQLALWNGALYTE